MSHLYLHDKKHVRKYHLLQQLLYLPPSKIKDTTVTVTEMNTSNEHKPKDTNRLNSTAPSKQNEDETEKMTTTMPHQPNEQ